MIQSSFQIFATGDARAVLDPACRLTARVRLLKILILAMGLGGLAIVAALCVSASAAPMGSVHDPWEGVDNDGRIPKVAKPDNLSHPERWRYIPEGRLKPGNIFQRFIVSSFVAPFFFRDSDVGFGGGVAIIDIDFREQRRREFLAVLGSYTVEGQQTYRVTWRRWLHHREVQGGGVIQEERSFLWAGAGYEKSLTRRFFGFGAGSSKGDESSYSDETAFGRFGFDLALPGPGDDFVLGAGLMGEWHSLGSGHVGGEPNTRDAYAEIFSRAEHHSLGWLELELRYDTRDSQRQPYRGFSVGIEIDSALIQSHSDVGSVFSLSGTKLFPLPPLLHDGGDAQEENPPTDTLAVILETRTIAGDLPFFSHPSLGGSRTLRGFIAGRFRDDSSWHGSVEYRFWVMPRGFPIPFVDAIRVERAGLALFADVGSVADDWPDLFRSRVKANGGIGFRLTLERSAPLRIDIGFSGEDIQVTGGFGLSF